MHSSIYRFAYCLSQLEVSKALPIAAAYSVLCGIVYPWNVALKLFPEAQPTPKYPIHYFPEALMTVLSAAGLYLTFKK